jgi:hypothetical protein
VHKGGEGNNNLDMIKVSIYCCYLLKFWPFSKM